MKALKIVLRKEWAAFLGSERGVFAIYAILVISWSFLPLSSGFGTGPIWWLFFAIIISGNFSNTVFVSERLNGAMEVLLTSGLSRQAVLFGKVAFTAGMSLVVGAACLGLSSIWLQLTGTSHVVGFNGAMQGITLYCGGALMNAACGAWLSVRMQSPRIIPFISIILAALILAVYYTLGYTLGASPWVLAVLLLVSAGIFLLLAHKEFAGEKVVQPINI